MNPFNLHSPRFLLTVGVVSAVAFAVTLLPSARFLKGDLTGENAADICDTDEDGELSVAEMRQCIRSMIRGMGRNPEAYDLDGNGVTNRDDLRELVRGIRKELSAPSDSDDDSDSDSSDGSDDSDSEHSDESASDSYRPDPDSPPNPCEDRGCRCSESGFYDCSNIVNASDPTYLVTPEYNTLMHCSGQACTSTPDDADTDRDPAPAAAAPAAWCTDILGRQCLHACGAQQQEVTGRCSGTHKCCAPRASSRASTPRCGASDPCCGHCEPRFAPVDRCPYGGRPGTCPGTDICCS